MPHPTPTRRTLALVASSIPLAALLVAAALGLAACGGSSSTTTTTNAASANEPAANAPSANAPASTTTGTTAPATTPTGSSPGSSGSSTGSTAPLRPNPARFSAMRECLAKKGIALPQRTPGGPGGFLGGAGGAQLPKGVSRTQFQEALRSCGGGFTGARLGRARGLYNSPRFHAALVRFAACLRQNGINVGEPNTSGKGPVFGVKGLNTGSPQFRAASTKCRSALFSGLRSRARPGSAVGG